MKSKARESTRYRVEGLPESWNEKFLEIGRLKPIKAGNLSIHFDRSPDIFAIPKITSCKNVPLGFFDGDHLIGFAIASYQKRYIRGDLKDVIYLGNLHVTEKGTSRIFLEKMSERVRQKVQNRPEVKYLYAYVMQSNQPARKLAGLGHLDSKVAGSISMSTIFTLKPVSENRLYFVRKAGFSDIDRIVELLSEEFRNQILAPEMNREVFIRNLENRPDVKIGNYYLAVRGDEIVGACLAWDMTSIKKNRIQYHGFKMNFIRQTYNFAARLAGSKPLPKQDKAMKDVTIAEYAVRDRNPVIMEALLRFIYREYRRKGYHSLIFGCATSDPIIHAVKPFISREVRSNVIIAPLQRDSERDFENFSGIYADAIQI